MLAAMASVCCFLAAAGPARAVPPAECARKFVGQWTVDGPTGSYMATIRRDGTGTAHCALCMPVQQWTCEGNNYILLTPYRHVSTLSPDGRSMTGGGITAYRPGGVPTGPGVSVMNPRTGAPSYGAAAPRIGGPSVNARAPRLRTSAPTVGYPAPVVRAPVVTYRAPVMRTPTITGLRRR
jgi:hypothetical protein